MLFLFIFIIFFLLLKDYIFFFLGNFKSFIYYSFSDFINYFRLKKYNLCNYYGYIYIFTGSGSQVFGSGKTLSMVDKAIKLYKRYDGLQVYDDKLGKFVTQHIHIISNVELNGVEYIPFKDVNQFIDIDKYNFGSMDVTIYLLDESGAIFNSREYKNNISSDMLTRLVQSRKNKCCLFMTSQRLQFTDKLLRQITKSCISCSKWWRVVTLKSYNAYDLECAYNPQLVKATKREFFFCTNNTFKQYNTYQLIDDLNKQYTPLSNEEILQNIGQLDNLSINNSTSIKRKFSPYKKGGRK